MTIGIIISFIFSCVFLLVGLYFVGKSLVILESIGNKTESYKGLPMVLKELPFGRWWLALLLTDTFNYFMLGFKKHYEWLREDYQSIFVILTVLLIVAAVNYYSYDYSNVNSNRKLDLVKRDKRRITFLILPWFGVVSWNAILTVIGFVSRFS